MNICIPLSMVFSLYCLNSNYDMISILSYFNSTESKFNIFFLINQSKYHFISFGKHDYYEKQSIIYSF